MKVHNNIEFLKPIKKPIVTIGTFDGVHAGHRAIIKRLIALAKSNEGESVLVTFEPHPRFLINPKHEIKLITLLEEKKELLSNLGLNHLIIVPFTVQFAQLKAKQYIEEFLIKKLKPHILVIGYDHHFGKGREGNINLLRNYEEKKCFQLEEISRQLVENAKVSSTIIRKALLSGDVKQANQLLQASFIMSGKVIEGDKIGRTINFPTANLKVNQDYKLIPANGVYAVKALIKNKAYQAVMNIGQRPTINEQLELRIEVHIFSFNKNIYNEFITIELIDRIRDEVKFESLELLKNQIQKDIITAKLILKKT